MEFQCHCTQQKCNKTYMLLPIDMLCCDDVVYIFVVFGTKKNNRNFHFRRKCVDMYNLFSISFYRSVSVSYKLLCCLMGRLFLFY